MSETGMKFDELTSQVMRLSPLEKVRLIERITHSLERELATSLSPEDSLAAWGQVYAGLSEQDIIEVEHLARDRSRFMKQEP